MKNSLSLLQSAQSYVEPSLEAADIRIGLVTNFTDDLLKKLLLGMCLAEKITPKVYQLQFKQYLFELHKKDSALKEQDVTFIFFDSNPYLANEFHTEGHVEEVLLNIQELCRSAKGVVVVHTLPATATQQHRRMLHDSTLLHKVQAFNTGLRTMAAATPNLSVIDTSQMLQEMGEHQARDMRGLYAFSQPFSNDFLYAIAREWMAFIRTLRGHMRKCLVLDLDNTLWGGVVGEAGPLGVALGPDYPGNAYQAFQRVILELHERGIILAINSRNNPKEVDDIFEQNPHCLLKKNQFAAIVTNWHDKAENLQTIAKELNIGLESMVFIDDDPVNRDLVRGLLPQVLVPDWSLAPEMYAQSLLDLDAFHTFRLTDEDRERGRMYAAERERKQIQNSFSPEEYIANLELHIDFSINNKDLIPRLAQLTQKTNQYNLTTHRSTETELASWIEKGYLIYAGDVRDRFGSYGVTILAAVQPETSTDASLAIFLMSCRVMGRKVEEQFFHMVEADLQKRGFRRLLASYIPTAKNIPIREFLPQMQAEELRRESEAGIVHYQLLLDHS